MPILLLNFSIVRFSDPHFAFLDDSFSTRRFSDNFPTAQNVVVETVVFSMPRCHDNTVH